VEPKEIAHLISCLADYAACGLIPIELCSSWTKKFWVMAEERGCREEVDAILQTQALTEMEAAIGGLSG
jgi:hypothetical protein